MYRDERWSNYVCYWVNIKWILIRHERNRFNYSDGWGALTNLEMPLIGCRVPLIRAHIGLYHLMSYEHIL